MTDFKIISNFKFPLIYENENINYALNYKPRNGQKFITSYPKSGTTWTQQIIYLILNNGVPETNGKAFMFTTFLEFMGKNCIKYPLIKTHLTYDLIPYNKFAKYLFVIRNPKDVCVSLYHHLKCRPFRLDGDFHDYFKAFISGQLIFGDYFEHLMSFTPHLFDGNFQYLVYEQMKDNPKKAVLKIAEFLGQEFMDKLRDNNELVLNEVLKYSTIEYMRTDRKDHEYVVRKGIVGDWRNHLNKDESDLIDRRCEQCFKGTVLEKLWEKDMKW